jgi:GNAT superfamily N-acetyltransferase
MSSEKSVEKSAAKKQFLKDVSLRAALYDDLDQVDALVNAAYRGDSSRKGWTTEADLLGGQRVDHERLGEMIAIPDSTLLLAFTDLTDKKLCGCVYLRKTDAKTCYVGLVTVDPKLQDFGLGSMLLEKSEEMAEAWGCQRMRMTVIDRRESLIEFYVRKGYASTGQWEPFPEEDPRYGIPKVKGLKLVELVKVLT